MGLIYYLLSVKFRPCSKLVGSPFGLEDSVYCEIDLHSIPRPVAP